MKAHLTVETSIVGKIRKSFDVPNGGKVHVGRTTERTQRKIRVEKRKARDGSPLVFVTLPHVTEARTIGELEPEGLGFSRRQGHVSLAPHRNLPNRVWAEKVTETGGELTHVKPGAGFEPTTGRDATLAHNESLLLDSRGKVTIRITKPWWKVW